MKKKKSLIRDLKENGSLLSMCIPGLIFFILFNYLPMFGIIIAFKQYRYDLGIWASPWNGLKNFEFMFSSPDAWVITRICCLFSAVLYLMWQWQSDFLN